MKETASIRENGHYCKQKHIRNPQRMSRGGEATQRSKLNIASAPQFPDWQGRDPEIIFKGKQ